MYDYPMHQFVDVSDGETGLALLTDGLKEYEIVDDGKRSIAITLLRSFEYKIEPSSLQDYSHKKGSQCLGESNFRVGIYPHKGDWLKGEVYEKALNFNNSVRLVQTSSSEGDLSPICSFLNIEPSELIFSALKKPENEAGNIFVLRLYNPTGMKIKGVIKTLFEIKNAARISLEEEYLSELKMIDSNSVEISLNRKEIVTMKLEIKGLKREK
jgi:alpha-mannosidase